MSNFVIDATTFVCAGVLPVLTMVGVIIFSGYMAFYDFVRERNINISKTSGFIGGFVVFAFITLVLSSPVVQEALTFTILPLASLVTAVICMFPAGFGVGVLSSYLAKNVYERDYFGVVLGALNGGALTALYGYATSEEAFRFMVAGLSLGFLSGVIAFVMPNSKDIARILSGRPLDDSKPGGDTTVGGATVN